MKKYYNIELSPKADITVVAFGGIANQLMVPVFEFFNILKEFNFNKIFVKDDYQSWYYKMGHDNLAKDLKKYIPENNRTIFIGTSAGAFAAILLGNMLNADIVLAFSPQTFLDKEYRNKFNDNRWTREINNVYKVTKNANKLRLENLIIDNDITSYYIYYCSKFNIDVIHANMLRGKKNFILRPQNCNTHVVVKWLKEKNLLLNLLTEALNGNL